MKVISEPTTFAAPTIFRLLPAEFVGMFAASDVTPSVANVRVWKCGGAVVTITDLDDASDGFLAILGDGATTISHNANIKTNTGANKLLAANRIYLFVHIDGIFYEN